MFYLNVYYRKALRIHYELKYLNSNIPNLLRDKENNEILISLLYLMKRICRRLGIVSTMQKTCFLYELLKPDHTWYRIYLDAIGMFGEVIGEYDCDECEDVQKSQLLNVLTKMFYIWSGTQLIQKNNLILVKPDELAIKCLNL
jgi:hypothetical protein